MCGVDSRDGKEKCGLNICCSYYGWCGTNSTHCGDRDEEGHPTPCQKDFGKCEVVPSPSCGQGSGSASNGRHVAYYQGWNTRQRQCNRIWPESINTTGLTHLNFAFASIDPKTFEITPMHQEDVNLYPRFTALKSGGLQTWIAVGGWEFSDPGPTRNTWSNMVSTQGNRAKFAASAVRFMDRYGFQGLDLDWEYPGTKERGGNENHDTENQISLVVELRNAFGNKYGLSSILAPDFWYLRKMDPRAMMDQVDFFNFMGYDLHGAWDAGIGTIGAKIRPHTDIREIDQGLTPLWFNGVDPKKVNLGMALYGRGYTSKSNCLQFGCEFSGPNAKSNCTNFDGFMSNYEIRQLIKRKGLRPELMKDAMVKQIAWDDQWVGYDDEETYAMKIGFANDRCLGGTMVWAIDYDSGRG
ncbi:glycoside hydrolase family 18 protein, partial [Amniculicola lignicola CBS 123094]